MVHIHRRDVLRLTAAGVATSWWRPTFADDSPKVPAPKPDPYSDAKFVAGPPPKPAASSFTVAVLPDTQHYSETYPNTYLAQTRWIVEQRAERNIACVLHLGDITNRNTAAEWRNAARAMAQFDGRVPYCLAVGNHDYSAGGVCMDRTTQVNDYFPVKAFRDRPTYGGTYDRELDRMENNYNLFSAGGRDFVVFCLEFGPRADVVRWANDVATKYPKREIILVTHAFVYHDDKRYNWAKLGTKQSWNPHNYPVAKATKDDVNDGEELWNKLVSQHENFILTLNGHVLGSGLGRTITPTPAGRNVPQVLVNFQMKPNGGDGWLRLLEFRNDGRVEVFDYSPTRDQCNVSDKNRFSMALAAPRAV